MANERIQRRLAAILAADVVGYSRMMEADEAGPLAQLNAIRSELFNPKTEQFGGRIFKSAFSGSAACDYEDHAAPGTNSTSQPPPRTSGNSQS